MRRATALLLISTMFIAACATAPRAAAPGAKPANIKEWLAGQSRARKRAMVGFALGALAGVANAAITGASNEDVWKHALAGGVAGAVAGYAMGKRQDRIFAARDLAVQQVAYDRSQGYVARIEQVTFDPPEPKPGQTATLYVRYVVLGPDPNEAITVTMFRGLKYGEDYVFGAGPNEFVVPRGGAVVESTMDVTLPKKVPQGTYSIEALIEDTQGRFPQVVSTGAVYIVAAAPRPGARRAA